MPNSIPVLRVDNFGLAALMGAVVVVRRLAIRFDTIITPRAVTPDVVEAGAVVIGHVEGTI